MKLKIKVTIDFPLLLAINEFVTSEQPTSEAIKEIKYLGKKILKNIKKKTEALDEELPEFRTLSDIK